MKPIDVAVIGTGWCGGIRAETLAAHSLVGGLHVAETNKERLAEISKKTRARTATTDYKELLSTKEIEAVYVSTTPESTHYPIARDCLAAGKHPFLEKPIAMKLSPARGIIALAKKKKLQITNRYTQRFQPEKTHVKK